MKYYFLTGDNYFPLAKYLTHALLIDQKSLLFGMQINSYTFRKVKCTPLFIWFVNMFETKFNSRLLLSAFVIVKLIFCFK